MHKKTITRGLGLFAAVAIGAVLTGSAVRALSIPSPSKVAREIEQRYHINASSVRSFSESFNVVDEKKPAPEVSIFFSPSDPREGQKITARAFPMYFTNPSEQMYYTWFLKREGCDLGTASGKPSYCNADGAGGITINDWKVAAMRILVTDGADKAGFSYRNDSDGDGYDAEFGGGRESGTENDWCYVHDASDGRFYELVSSTRSDAFSCGTDGYIPSCITGTQVMGSDLIETYIYEVSGTPSCVSDTPSCPDGTLARCVNPLVANLSFAIDETEDNLSCSSGDAETQRCVHLFPEPSGTGEDSGDGNFGVREEFFWGSNPADPDTADNGNKDEANVTGLGRDSFTWNYQVGDQLGVVVEGTSMVSTKHSDSSMMIMWAFSGTGCQVRNKGSYNTSIRGYSVNIPTADMSEDDLNECLENDLVDPIEGGQNKSKRLEIDVTATPENPTNDQTEEGAGDSVFATASISNASRPESEILYSWTVEVSDNAVDGWEDITDRLGDSGMLPSNEGNGLSSVSAALNMDRAFLAAVDGALPGTDPLYLRFSVRARENFSTGVFREGRGDVIVRVSNTTKKILTYSTTAADTGAGSRVAIDEPICDTFHPNPATAEEAIDNLDRVACRVMKNEIIGVRVDPSGLSDFRFTVDGAALSCNASISGDPACANGNEAFFAVVGNPGTSINVKLEATNVETGRSLTLSRTFNIVQPEIVLESSDEQSLWPRYVGQYTDLDGNSYDEYSRNFFEKYPESEITLRARFIPGFAERIADRSWTVDGEAVAESADMEIGFFSEEEPAGDVTNVTLSAVLLQPNEKRLALRDIWGIDASKTAETAISKSIQITNVDHEGGADSGIRKWYAAASAYVPPALSFAFRTIILGGLLLFVIGFAFSLAPEDPEGKIGRR